MSEMDKIRKKFLKTGVKGMEKAPIKAKNVFYIARY